MHKCVLKPLQGVVRAALQEFQVRSGAWQELQENLAQAKTRLPQDMGVDAPPTDPLAVERIRHRLQTLCKLYSPEKKVTVLLRVCKLIYNIMEDKSGEDDNDNAAAVKHFELVRSYTGVRQDLRRS